MGARFVTHYVVERVFGGHEEGGWYYSATRCENYTKCKSKEKAKKLCDKSNEDARLFNCSSEYDYFKVESRQHCGREDDMDKPAPRYC